MKDSSSSDGCVFIDKYGNSITLQGDVKTIRANGLINPSKYVEYHAETDIIPYESLFFLKRIMIQKAIQINIIILENI